MTDKTFYGLRGLAERLTDTLTDLMFPEYAQQPQSSETLQIEAAGLLKECLCFTGTGKENAGRVSSVLLNSLSDVKSRLFTDIEAAYKGDPAAASEDEVILCYPAFRAISTYRLAHVLYEQGVPLLPRLMSEYAHRLTGIDIHPGARIGNYFFIDHGTGVVIGETCTIGNNVKIIGTKEITNTVINDNCEINGASRISDCSILNGPSDSVYIGTGVICENSIICNGSSIINSVKMQDCFVGEACHIANGFTASQSVFFANSYMSNGEACAAFCGPFSASHHKSSLLIGGQFSFYNAGSNTNFSNHAYKMGPIHYGTLERGTKTASGSYVLMPAKIGAFSVCMGKLMHHPDTRDVPFSYLISYNDDMYLVPGRNITTVGLYRDIKKWPKRDMRQQGCQKSIVNFDWLSPFTVGEILRGKKILENLRAASGDLQSQYNYHDYVINASSLKKGIKYYDIALRLYMGAVLKRAKKHDYFRKPTTNIGKGNWIDLSGLLLPESEEVRLIEDIKNGTLETIQAVIDRFEEINDHYREYQWTWTYDMILNYYGLDEITEEDAERIREDYITARRIWIGEIRKDAEKEYAMGDVEDDVFSDFIDKLDHEIDYEN